MHQCLQVELGSRSYPINVGTGLLRALGDMCRENGLADKALIVSDSNVAPLYGQAAEASLQSAGYATSRAVLAAGETSKNKDNLFLLYDRAMDEGLDRHSFVVTLGGGVVGDIGGFMAASFLRGMDFVQVPTSLLAMVDSSVGGKTGINLPRGKNMVGAFHQPRLVLIDLETLLTLPLRERRAGLAEVVKYGIIHDERFFADLELDTARLLTDQGDFMTGVIARCCRIKAEVVSADERESGRRAALNFGHTLGHALEKVGGYGHHLHGEAVAIGMNYAAALSARAGLLQDSDAARITALLTRLDLPVEASGLCWTDVRMAMDADKKARSGSPRFVLAEAIGSVRCGCSVEEKLLENAWSDICAKK